MGNCLAPELLLFLFYWFPTSTPTEDDSDEIEHGVEKKKNQANRKKQLAHNCSTRGRGFLSRCCHLELCSSNSVGKYAHAIVCPNPCELFGSKR